MKWGSKEWLENQLTPNNDDDGDKWGHKWRASQKLRHKSIIKIIKQRIDAQVIKNVLDIGCSHGDFTKLLIEEFVNSEVYGTDISEIAIVEAKNNIPSSNFEVSSLPKIPFKDKKFDMILSLEVLYYLSDNDREKSLKNMYDRIEHNGYYVFSAVINKGEKYFSEQSAKSLLEKYFKIEECCFLNTKLYGIIEKPLNKIVQINSKINNSQLTTKVFVGRKQKIWEFLVKVKFDLVLKPTLYALSIVARKIISNITFALVCEKISKIFFNHWSKTSIVIIARKR